MKIPKEIVEKIRQANELNNEICKWMNDYIDNFEDFEVNSLFWEIVPEPRGESQDDDGEEYVDQRTYGEDWHMGEAYYKFEGESNYLEMHFEC